MQQIKTAGRILVVGTSLTVYPIAGLLEKARYQAEKIIVAYEVDRVPHGYRLLRGSAETLIPHICQRWLKEHDSAITPCLNKEIKNEEP